MTAHRTHVQTIIDQLDSIVGSGADDIRPAALAPLRTALVGLRDEPTTDTRPEAIVVVIEEGMQAGEGDLDDPQYEVGGVVIVCPGCSAENQLYEVDQHIGWNPIEVQGSLLCVMQDDTHRETIGYRCQDDTCGTEFDLPELGQYLDEKRGHWMMDDLYDITWS